MVFFCSFLSPSLRFDLILMKNRQLWPLLPPLVMALFMGGFLTLNKWMKASGFECGIRKVTGIYCPGCGGTRCAKSIVSGDLITALGHNAMLLSGFILLTAFFTFLIIRITILGKPAPKTPHIKKSWIWLGILSIALFTILRNIPSYPWNLLAP